MTGQRDKLGFRSPWLDQLDRIHAPTPLTEDFATDVAIVGAGIAGLATAFFVLRDTPSKVVLLERGRAGHGATGRNAGQLVTYFERPLCVLVDAFGFDKATRGQAEVEAAWGLLDAIIDESGMTVTIDRFVGAHDVHRRADGHAVIRQRVRSAALFVEPAGQPGRSDRAVS